MEWKSSSEPPKYSIRYGISGLMLLTIVFAVMGMAARQFLVSVGRGTSPRAPFVIFTLVAPALVVVALATGMQVARWLAKMRRR